MSDQTDPEQRMVELLGKGRRAELVSAELYQTLGEELKTFDGADVAEELALDADQEFGHARQFAEKIDELGYRPSELSDVDIDYSDVIPDDPTDVEHVVKGVYGMESDALEMYREIEEVAEEAGYGDIADFARQLQAEERAHMAEFRDLAQYEYDIGLDELEGG